MDIIVVGNYFSNVVWQRKFIKIKEKRNLLCICTSFFYIKIAKMFSCTCFYKYAFKNNVQFIKHTYYIVIIILVSFKYYVYFNNT